METLKGRRVFLDFRRNPFDKDIDFNKLSEEQRIYLENAGACFGTPLERLNHMNAPAISFYMDKGVDLSTQPLEIALCAQHNNGGLDIDCWWQTNIKGFFAAGEVAATHGVYRPGGSALNSGQVGSTRAAQFISAGCDNLADKTDDFPEISINSNILEIIKSTISFGENLLTGNESNIKQIWEKTAKNMSLFGGPIRDKDGISRCIKDVDKLLSTFTDEVKAVDKNELKDVYRLWDMLICQKVYLEAMLNYSENGGESRGSALYTNKNGKKPYDFLPDVFTYLMDDGSRADIVELVSFKNNKCVFSNRKIRPLPEDDEFFENVWRDFRKNGNVY